MAGDSVPRRKVLKGVGAGLAATALAGQASADEPQEFLIGVNGRSSAKQVASQAAGLMGESPHRIDLGDVRQVLKVTLPQQTVDQFRQLPSVEYIEKNSEYHALAQSVPWGIDRVDADVLHSNGETGNGADIAILDTGIDSDHPDLGANVAGGKCFAADCCGEASGGFRCNPNDNSCPNAWDDDNDHGTHCAGIADAVDNSEGVVGVSTEANLYAGKVLDGCGSGSLSSIADGIRWAADQGFDVASMSLGASSGDQTLKDAVQYAADKGLLMVAAAGNDGPCSDCVGYPAAYSEVIAVSSTASDDSLSDFSSTGPEVELAAPGSNINSTVPGGYAEFSGTSMACPHVSGAAGQLMADGASASQARQTLQDTAEDIGLGENESGYGLLDAEAAAGGGGGGDGSPSVSWANPSGGATVSGTVTVQIDASDSEDSAGSLTVEYTVGGGSARSTSYNSSTGYYEDSWDTTGVSDGDYALEASATDSAGNTTTSSITVTVDNVEDPVAVSTGSASSVSDTSATLNGSLDNLGGASSADVYFEWGPSGSLSNTTSAQTLSSTGSFSEDLSGLSSDTTYDFRAVVDAADGDSDTGSTNSFTTDSSSCFITTATAGEGETLNSLRRFRDESMSATPVGRGLVGLYYRISPPIAATLERHPESRAASAVEGIVDRCASLSNAQDETDSRVESAALGVALTNLYVVGIAVGAAGHAGLRARELLDGFLG